MRKRLLFIFLLAFFSYEYSNSQQSIISYDLPADASVEEVKKALDSIDSKLLREFYSQNYIDVLKYSDTAYLLAKRINDLEMEFRISRYVGSTLIKMHDTIRAKSVFEKSLQIALERGDSRAIGLSKADLGNFYGEIGNNDKAIAHYSEALEIIEESPENARQIIILHHNLTELYLRRKDVVKSRYHIRKLSGIIDVSQSSLLKSGYYLSKGRLHLLEHQPDKAIGAFQNSIELAKRNDYIEGIVEGYEGYLEALIDKKDYKKAHFIRQELDLHTDRKVEVEKAAAINEVTARMNIEQYKQKLKAKELENEINQQKTDRINIILFIVVGASCVLSVVLLMLLLSSKKRKDLVRNLQDRNMQYLKAKRKAEELSKVKTNFLSAISHELRTPLYGIIGISTILQQDPKLKDNKEDITSLKFSADYLLALVNDLLFLNKLEVFKNQKLEKKPFDIRELVSNIINSLEFMRNKNNNAFVVQIDSKVPHLLKGDYVKLSQVLINLIGNACKFTEEGTIKVIIASSDLNSKSVNIHFQIIDDGIGISKEKQAIIFDEFTQDKKATTFQGTGLGLAIVKRLLDLHNAPISLKSELNIGTEFKFSIDYELAEVHEIEMVKKIEQVDRHIEGSHVLIVDDNKINRLVTRKILEGQSYVCTMAENGAEAVKIAKEEVFDLILMDLNMPVMNGFEATAKIRRFNQNVPIIALTATDPSQLSENLNEIGFSDVIIKPYETSDFLEIIKKNFLSTIKV